MQLSPKFQCHEVGEPVLLSVNFTFKGAFPETGHAENAATRRTGFSPIGICFIPIDCPKATGPFPTFTVAVTLFVAVSITDTLLLW